MLPRRGRKETAPRRSARAARSGLAALAFTAAAFSLSVLLLLVADYTRLRSSDPLGDAPLAGLREELKAQPESRELREEIRRLDLIARRAYFSSTDFRRRGAWLLLGGVAVALLALKGRRSLSPSRPHPGRFSGAPEPSFAPAASRRFVAVSGLVTTAGAVLLFLLFRVPDLPVTTAPAPGEDTFPSVEERWAGRTRQWPSFRGPDGLGRAFFENASLDWDGGEGRNILWKAPIPRAGFSSPVVWGDRVFLTGGDDKGMEIYSWHAITGELLWKRAVAVPAGGLPEVTPDTGHAAPTAATDGVRLFAVFSTGTVVAVDFEGRHLWSRSFGIPDNPYGHAASLLVWKDSLIVQFDQRDQARVTALEASSGMTVWETVRDQDISWSSPVLIPGPAGTELVLNGNPAVVSYDPLTGIELWRVDCMSGELAPSPAYAAGTVFAANEYARLAAISLEGAPSIAWEYAEGLPEVSSPVATDDYVFMANGYGIVTCLDSRTGKLLWEEEFGEGFYASPIVVGDRVYLMDRSGVMHIFAAAGEFRPLGNPALGESSTVTGAFLDGRIYLRGEHHLFCIGEGS